MKLHIYLWKYCEMLDDAQGKSPEQIQGELRQFLGDEEITSNSTDETLSEREAKSIFGRNEDKLWEAYHADNKPLFAALCMRQQVSDDEWQKLKEELWAQEESQEPEEAEGAGEAQ